MARERSKPAAIESSEAPSSEGIPNPVWFKPIMFGFMLIGLLWVIVFYVSKATLPIPGIANWNLLIGLGIGMIGFLMTTRWR